MCHKKSVPSSRLSVLSKACVGTGDPPVQSLFLLRGGLLRRGLLRSSFFLGPSLPRLCFCRRCFYLRGLQFLRLRFFLRQRGGLEALSIKSDLGNAHRGNSLPEAAQLLVM